MCLQEQKQDTRMHHLHEIIIINNTVSDSCYDREGGGNSWMDGCKEMYGGRMDIALLVWHAWAAGGYEYAF